MRQHTVLILGDHDSSFALHQATREAITAASVPLGTVVNTRWMGPDDLQLYPGLVAEASGVVLAPPGKKAQRVFPEPIVSSLTLVRERNLPFLATGRAHGLVFVELARNLLQMRGAGSTAYDEDTVDPIVCQLPRRVGERDVSEPRPVELEVVPKTPIADLYRTRSTITEQTDITHGLNPDYAQGLTDAGLLPGLVDPQGGRPYLHFLSGLRFHVTAAFLPQLRSKSGAPHPLFLGLVEQALATR